MKYLKLFEDYFISKKDFLKGRTMKSNKFAQRSLKDIEASNKGLEVNYDKEKQIAPEDFKQNIPVLTFRGEKFRRDLDQEDIGRFDYYMDFEKYKIPLYSIDAKEKLENGQKRGFSVNYENQLITKLKSITYGIDLNKDEFGNGNKKFIIFIKTTGASYIGFYKNKNDGLKDILNILDVIDNFLNKKISNVSIEDITNGRITDNTDYWH